MFSATVICGNSASDWNTMPKSRRFAGTCVTSLPANTTLPEVGVSRPAMIRSSVVLPQPDGPRKQTSLPSGTLRSTLSTAVAPLKRFVTDCKVRWVMAIPFAWRGSRETRTSKRDTFVADQFFEHPDQREIDRDDEPREREHGRIERRHRAAVQPHRQRHRVDAVQEERHREFVERDDER